MWFFSKLSKKWPALRRFLDFRYFWRKKIATKFGVGWSPVGWASVVVSGALNRNFGGVPNITRVVGKMGVGGSLFWFIGLPVLVCGLLKR